MPPGIQVYRLDTAFFLRRGGEVITLDEVRDPERVAAWLTRLSQGVNTEEYATQLGDPQRGEWHDLCRRLTELGVLVADITEAHPATSGGSFASPETDVSGRPRGGTRPLRASCAGETSGFPGNESPTRYLDRPLTPTERHRLATARIETTGHAPEEFHHELRRLLEISGIGTQTNSDIAFLLTIYVKTMTTTEADLLAFDRQTTPARRPWLLVDLGLGDHLGIGPLFGVPALPCYHCFCERRFVNDDPLVRHARRDPPLLAEKTAPHHPWQHAFAAALIVDQIVSVALGETARCAGRALYCDTRRHETWTETVLAFPGCPVCAAARRQ